MLDDNSHLVILFWVGHRPVDLKKDNRIKERKERMKRKTKKKDRKERQKRKTEKTDRTLIISSC